MTAAECARAIATTLALLLASVGLGNACLRWLRLDDRGPGSAWFSLLLGLPLLSLTTLGLGLASQLRLTVILPLLVVAATAGSWALARGCWRGGRAAVARIVGAGVARVFATLALLVCAGTAVWIGLAHSLMPPHEWDELAYHLAVPKLYARAAAIHYLPTIQQSNWPLGSEMPFAAALLLGSDLAPHLLMLATAVATGLGLLLVADRHLDSRGGPYAAAVFLTFPLVQRLAGTGTADVVPGLYVLGALAALAEWRRSSRDAWLVVTGVLAGAAAACKYTGAAFPVLFGAVLLWRGRPQTHARRWRAVILFSAGALAVAGPWYARSAWYTGDPVFPFGFGLFGGRNWDALGATHGRLLLEVWGAHFPRTPAGLWSSLVHVVRYPERMGHYGVGFGLALPVGLAASAVLVRRLGWLTRDALAISAGFYLLWFLLASHELRLLLPIAPLLALAAGQAAVCLPEAPRRLPARLAAGAVALALVLYQWPWTRGEQLELLARRWPYLTGEVSRPALLARLVGGFGLFAEANRVLPAHARVLLLPYETRGYLLDRDYLWGNPASQRLIRFEGFEDVPELWATLRTLGVTHVLHNTSWSYEGLRDWQRIALLLSRLEQHCGRLLYGTPPDALYALTPCREGAIGRLAP